jgi:heat shock protein HslJ
VRRLLALAVVATLLLAACGDDDDVTSDDATTTTAAGDGAPEPAPAPLSAEALEGRTFVSQEVTGRELADGGETIRLTFDEGRLGASAGCNQMSAGYELDGTRLSWTGEPMSTMMGCSEQLMAQDTWLAELLVGGVDASLDGAELVLIAAEVTIALLDEQEAVPDQPLTGTTWTLDTLIDGETASSVPAGVGAPTLEIGDDGTVQVFTGCNRGNGTAEVGDEGTTVSFGPLATTRMACPEGGSDVEAQVLAVLEGEVEVDLDGDQLTLTKGDRALGFRAG